MLYEALTHLHTVRFHSVWYQYETVDELNEKIVESIKGYMQTKCKSIHLNESKLSKETLDMIASRVELIKNGKRDSEEYRNLTKTINKTMR